MLKWFTKKQKSEQPSVGVANTLDTLSEGACVNIECLRGDIKECQRLREMGFCENARVEKLSDNGAVICKVCNSKVIISQGLAKNIIVTTQFPQVRPNMSEEKSNFICLSQLKEGQSGKVHDFIEENDTCARLEEMGVTPGELVEVVRYAPLGDPIEIKIRGYHLSLRKEEADLITVRI